jgi:glycosyltransferase involved in cell wall biosynthesis
MKRIHIFTALNHISNEFETLKLAKKYPIKWHYLENNVRKWSEYSARPLPQTFLSTDEFEWVQYYEPGKYDLAILRNDQQHADPMIGKGRLFRDMNEVIQDIPKIVVNHGTPMWSVDYTEDIVKYGGVVETSRGPRQIDGIKDLVKDCDLMIVNSYRAVERWEGVHDHIYPLIHGLNPDEWWDLPKEPRVVLPLSPAGLDDYYNRTLCTAIKAEVRERTGLEVQHPNVNIEFSHDNWREYREFIGSSLVCIFPFKDSPMPRSRTEAMLSGCTVLSSRYHNADEFITTGENGFILPDNPLSYAEAIRLLVNEGYRDALKIGQAGKQTATELFSLDRYLDDWWAVIDSMVNKKKLPVWDGTKVWRP